MKFSRDKKQRETELIDFVKELITESGGKHVLGNLEDYTFKVLECDFGTFVFNLPDGLTYDDSVYIKYMADIVMLNESIQTLNVKYKDEIEKLLESVYEGAENPGFESINKTAKDINKISEKLEKAKVKLYPLHTITYFNIDTDDENEKIFAFILVKDTPNSPGAYSKFLDYLMAMDCDILPSVEKIYSDYRKRSEK